jgi:outer membrane protein TolC
VSLSSTRAELQEAIASYQKLIANYTLSRERMLVRRRDGPKHVMEELDEQIKVNQRTIDALQRAIETAREQLKTMERA